MKISGVLSVLLLADAHPKGVEGQCCRTAAPQFEVLKNNDVVDKVI